MALEYVIITPARNEAAFIEKTIQSVIAQTVLPKRWMIVSDGSTDGTDEIVEKYVRSVQLDRTLRLPVRRRSSLCRKVKRSTQGMKRQGFTFDVVGNIDADVSFGPGFSSSCWAGSSRTEPGRGRDALHRRRLPFF